MIGVHQGEAIGALPVVGKRGSLEIRHGTLNDGVGRATVENYLWDAFGGGLVERYNTSPEVRLIGSADSYFINRVAAAVQLVNTALPADSKISMGAPMPDFSLRHTVDGQGLHYPSGQELENVIHVEFVSDFYDAWTAGTAWNQHNQDGSVRSSYIQANSGAVPGPFAFGNDRHSVALLVHEIIHALGIQEHVPLDSIMTPDFGVSGVADASHNSSQPLSLLHPADREALQALYGRLSNGASPTDFGIWESTSRHIAGRGEHATFGVALRNGYAEPWVYGYIPGSDLAGNTALTGTATWQGALLGFTPDTAPVAGNAEVGINLSDLSGQASFTSLESWAAGEAPGGPGTGAIWGDGDLAYSIAVNGNTFRQTGGDDGILTGAFFGTSHEAMGGTLERDDLTAAFGGRR